MSRVLLLAGVGILPLLCAGTADAAPSVSRGEYLVTGPAGCGNCHTPLGAAGPDISRALGGRLVDENPAFIAYAPNITPGGHVADWTDEELARAIREGLRPDGTLIGPPMPFALYRGLSDDDLQSIVAYLRTVPAVEGEQPESVYNIPLPPAYGPPVESVPHPEEGVTVEYGAYLAGPVAHCMECHTPHGPQGPLLDTHAGAGGFEFRGPWGVSVAANLTPHPEDGIADDTDEELKVMITQGLRPDGTPMMPPMPYAYLANMTREDLDAIILYLRSLKPLPLPQ
ncbi:c-type cytochrome [Paracoccus sp. T5]|uniref:c-type cytochrome n=1 Tax=Paracoccus sp. T5 TaxID=3402161 RepID=UPI003AE37DF3